MFCECQGKSPVGVRGGTAEGDRESRAETTENKPQCDNDDQQNHRAPPSCTSLPVGLLHSRRMAVQHRGESDPAMTVYFCAGSVMSFQPPR